MMGLISVMHYTFAATAMEILGNQQAPGFVCLSVDGMTQALLPFLFFASMEWKRTGVVSLHVGSLPESCALP